MSTRTHPLALGALSLAALLALSACGGPGDDQDASAESSAGTESSASSSASEESSASGSASAAEESGEPSGSESDSDSADESQEQAADDSSDPSAAPEGSAQEGSDQQGADREGSGQANSGGHDRGGQNGSGPEASGAAGADDSAAGPGAGQPASDADPSAAQDATGGGTGDAVEDQAAHAAAPAAPAADPGTCDAASLTGALQPVDAGMGSVHYDLVLTNTGSEPCVLVGYPGVSYLDAAGQPVGIPAVRAAESGAAVTVAPGQSASAGLQETGVGAYGQVCNPHETSALLVYPPESTEALSVPHATQACGNPKITQLQVKGFGA